MSRNQPAFELIMIQLDQKQDKVKATYRPALRVANASIGYHHVSPPDQMVNACQTILPV